MAKPRKKTAAPEPPPMPQVGDKVKPARSEMVYEISKVHVGGDEVDLHVPGTNLERFRVRTDSITFVERKPPAFTNPEPTFDAGEVLKRIRAVERQSSQRLDDDIAILTKYLKTQDVPKAVIDALDGLSSNRRESWKDCGQKDRRIVGGLETGWWTEGRMASYIGYVPLCCERH
jgi:hypothetical protein